MGKKLAIGIISVLLIVAAVPVIVYGGLTTDVYEAETTLSLSGGGEPSAAQPGGSYDYDPQLSDIAIERKEVSAYQQMWQDVAGERASVESDGEGQDNAAIVDIVIKINLETPSGQVIENEFNPRQMNVENEQTIKIELTEGDLAGETGTFTLTIQISISITPPIMDSPIVELELSPVSQTFEVGAEA